MAICASEISISAGYSFPAVCELDNGPVSIIPSNVHSSSKLDHVSIDPVSDIDIFQICLCLKFKEVFRQNNLLVVQLSDVHVLFFGPKFIAGINLLILNFISVLNVIVNPNLNNSLIGVFIFDFIIASAPLVLLISWDNVCDPLPNLSADDV